MAGKEEEEEAAANAIEEPQKEQEQEQSESGGGGAEGEERKKLFGSYIGLSFSLFLALLPANSLSLIPTLQTHLDHDHLVYALHSNTVTSLRMNKTHRAECALCTRGVWHNAENAKCKLDKGVATDFRAIIKAFPDCFDVNTGGFLIDRCKYMIYSEVMHSYLNPVQLLK